MRSRARIYLSLAFIVSCDGQVPQGDVAGPDASLRVNQNAARTILPAAPASPPSDAERVTVNLVLPSSHRSTQDLAVLANGDVRFEPSARLESSIPGRHPIIAATSEDADVVLRPSSDVGSVESIGPVVVLPGATINGDAVSGDAISNEGTIVGAVTEYSPLGTRPLQLSYSFPPSTNVDVIVQRGATRTLTPGHYRSLRIERDATVQLSGGSYRFGTLDSQPGSTLSIAPGASARIAVDRVRRFGATVQTDSPDKLLVLLPQPDRIAVESQVNATILAPNAEVTIATGVRGSVVAKSVVVGPSAELVHVPNTQALIDSIAVSDSTPCAGESVRIEVRAARPDAEVAINGIYSRTRDVSFDNLATSLVTVTVYAGGDASFETFEVTTHACTQERRVADVVAGMSRYAPNTVEYRVRHMPDNEDVAEQYYWSFGDGTTAITTTPFVEHDFSDAMSATRPYEEFDVSVTMEFADGESLTARKFSTIGNLYAQTRLRGYAALISTAASNRLVRDGGTLRGQFIVRNPEDVPVTLDLDRLERHGCDSSEPTFEPPNDEHWRVLDEAGVPMTTLEVPAQGRREITIEIRLVEYESTCAVRPTWAGTLGPVRLDAGFTFETGAHRSGEQTITDTAFLAALNQMVRDGLAPNPDVITERDYFRALQSGQLEAPVLPPVSNDDSALQGGTAIGSRCEPGDTPDSPGIACLATDDFTLSPPLIRNALKGDLIIGAGCGQIGQLLRALTPRQRYTHEAIMTGNYFRFAHSTASQQAIEGSLPERVRQGTGELDEQALRFSWPGSLSVSVDEGFNGQYFFNPRDEKSYRILAFSPLPTFCEGDGELSPPLMVRPLARDSGLVRDRLHAAADLANVDAAHYRWFGYSQGAIALRPEFDALPTDIAEGRGPATVSTTFIWRNLKRANIVLEGAEWEDSDSGSPVPDLDVMSDQEGLYLYTEAERRAAGEVIWASTRNAVQKKHYEAHARPILWTTFGATTVVSFVVPPLAIADVAWLTLIGLSETQAERVANQLTNCFASDDCGSSAADSEAWKHPGEGISVSPDDFRNWDSVADGGVYGTTEALEYRGGEYRRIYRWTASEGTGAIHGFVRLEDGTAVSDASITVGGRNGGTVDDGSYAIGGIPAGRHVVQVRKRVSRLDHTVDCPPDDIESLNCDVLSADVDITIAPGDDLPVDVVIALQSNLPPPGLRERHVAIEVAYHLVDDEVDNDNNVAEDGVLGAQCDVSPEPGRETDVVHVQTPCVGEEVRASVEITCTLNEATGAVDVRASVRMTEGRERKACSDDDYADSGEVTITVPFCDRPTFGECPPTETERLDLRNDDETAGGDIAQLTFKYVNYLPALEPENFRLVQGDLRGSVTDDEWRNNDVTEPFELRPFCQVDPLHRISTFSVSPECVDFEVSFVARGTCVLMPDDASVDLRVTYEMFEGTSCARNDRDDHQDQEFVLEPCAIIGECAAVGAPLTLENRGDRVDLTTAMFENWAQ